MEALSQSYPIAPTQLPDASNLHVLALINPTSSRNKLASKQFAAMMELGYAGRNDYMFTEKSSRGTAYSLYDKLTCGSSSYNVVVALTGDGSSSKAAAAILSSNDIGVRVTPIVFGDCGGENDGHHMTQKTGRHEDYIRDLPCQPVIAVPPMEIIIERELQKDQHLTALFHAGVGQSGRLSHFINQPGHRTNKLVGTRFGQRIAEHVTGLRSFTTTTRFYGERSDSASPRKTAEWLLINGSRMAGYNLFPGNLTEPNFYEIVARSRTELARFAISLALDNNNPMAAVTSASLYVAPADYEQPLYMHVDGEEVIIAHPRSPKSDAMTRITVSTASKRLYVAAPALASNARPKLQRLA